MNHKYLVPDVFNKVLNFLPLKDICRVSQVCLQLRSITNEAWSELCKSRYGCLKTLEPKQEFMRRSFAENGCCSICRTSTIFSHTPPERGLAFCFKCYCQEITSLPDILEKRPTFTNEEFADIPSWEVKHEHLGNIPYCLKSDFKAYLASKGEAKKTPWRKLLFERLQLSMDSHKAKHLAMHAMPEKDTTVEELAKYYIDQEKEREEGERLAGLQQALGALNISMNDIPAVYSPLIQAYVQGKKTIYTMNELVTLLKSSSKHRSFDAALATAETNRGKK